MESEFYAQKIFLGACCLLVFALGIWQVARPEQDRLDPRVPYADALDEPHLAPTVAPASASVPPVQEVVEDQPISFAESQPADALIAELEERILRDSQPSTTRLSDSVFDPDPLGLEDSVFDPDPLGLNDSFGLDTDLYDCSDFSSSVSVLGADPYGLDRDGDGTGCENNRESNDWQDLMVPPASSAAGTACPSETFNPGAGWERVPSTNTLDPCPATIWRETR